VYQHRSNGQINRMINLRAALVGTSYTGTIDITMTDASGRVIKDSRAERIAEHSRFIALITAAIEKHPLLKALLASYRAAVHNPTHELIHLYEIRDALADIEQGQIGRIWFIWHDFCPTVPKRRQKRRILPDLPLKPPGRSLNSPAGPVERGLCRAMGRF